MRRFVSLIALAALVVTVACSTSTQHTPMSSVLAKIELTAPNPNIVVGQAEQITATGFFSDGSGRDITSSVSWASSQTSVATVNSSGTLTAVASGQTSITATMQGFTGSVSVTVAPALVSIAVAPANPKIARQTTIQFIATGTFSDNSTKNLTSSADWSSSDTSIVTMSSTVPTKGLATGIAAGQSTITATMGSVTGTTTLTVTSASATSLEVTPDSIAMPLGISQQFTATAGFSDGTSQDVTNVTQWKSSASSVASITTSGLVTARNVGSSTITGTFEAIPATASVTVNAANLLSIAITPADGSIAQGTNEQLTAKGTFNDGSTRDVTFLSTWSSSNPSVGSISASNGSVSAVTPGTITATATLGSMVGSTSVTVTNAMLTSVLISPTNVTIPTGGFANFTATGLFSDNTTQLITNLSSWSSSNTAVATVANAPNAGFATAVNAGMANIVASATIAGTTKTSTTALTVSAATLASIALAPQKAEIAPASSQEYIATGTFTDGSSANITAVAQWSSSDTNVAVVSHSGVITGESSGVVTITAKDSGVSATADLLVESSALVSLVVTPQNSIVPAGFETNFKAVGNFSNGDVQDLTAFVTWTSSNAAAATISNTQATAGRATGVAPGATNISALFAGQVGMATLTVTNATLTAINVTPSSASIPAGQSKQFDATGSFTDSSTLDLLDQVTWSSSNPNVATITTDGVANALASGTSTISADLNGAKGIAILTVQ